MTQLSKIMGLSKNCIVVCIIFSLVSCAQFDTPKRMAIKGQPGDYFVEQIKEQHLNSLKEIVALLQHPDFKKQKAKTYLTKEVQDTAILLKEISFSESTSQAIIQLSKTKPDKTEKWVAIGLQLYPIDAYRIIEQLYADSTIQESALESAALTAGLDPDRLLPATASGDLEYRIVPLINSASLTVYNQTEGAETRLWFKSSDSDKWLPALSLQWEPIMGALSGSIVRLQADTAYDIKLEYLDDSDVTEERLYSFKTRPNSPPIDPEKIYYLSDIYTGGQLNLTTLGIEGSETGWALIKGDGVEIIAGTEDESAIDIGSQSFIKFENIHVIGGKKYGVKSKNAHHIWIKGCDISQYGRVGEDMRDGVAYDTSESTTPINYDSGIYLTNTGVVTIEDCEIHDPNGKANNWGYGHPNGPNAMLLSAYHPEEEYRGQYIIRNNRFYGTAEHRFNDVIESRSNGRIWGGFVRDSAIHNNYLAYANDDIIELDGGQSNVLFYNNEIEQGYCGVSAIPNMLGPSYIFNNFIHNLGDERQKSWAAIKLGGLISAPAGLVNIFENLIVTSSNGIASAGFKSDSTFWTNVRNNILIHDVHWNNMGFGIYDTQFYEGSNFDNNVVYNTRYGDAVVSAVVDEDFYHPWSQLPDKINDIINSGSVFNLEVEPRFTIPNFSVSSQLSLFTASGPESDELINFYDKNLTSFDNQDRNGKYSIEDNGNTLVLTGNSWKSLDFPYNVVKDSYIQFDLKTNGQGEIIGIALENDNKLTSNRLFKFAGSQPWVQDQFKYQEFDSFVTMSIPIGQFMSGDINRLVFLVDRDKASKIQPKAYFKNVKLITPDVYVERTDRQQTSNEADVTALNFLNRPIRSFANEDKDKIYQIVEDGNAISLTGNTWKSVDFNQDITPQTVLEFEIKSNGAGEIAGISFEDNNILSKGKLYKFSGSQRWENDLYSYSNIGEFETITLPVGKLLTEPFDRLVFVMDNDQTTSTKAEVTFRNIKFYESKPDKFPQSQTAASVEVGITTNN